MANTKSAAKQARKAVRRRTLNRKTQEAVRQVTKKIKTLAREGKVEEAQQFYATFQSTLDKAAKTKRMHRNTASRKKSRVARLLKKPVVAAPVSAAPKAKAVKGNKAKAKAKK